LAQPIADGIKLFFKEDIIPTNVDKTLYIMAPAIALAPVLMSVAVLPWNGSPNWGTVAPGLNIGILFLLAIASIEVYGVIWRAGRRTTSTRCWAVAREFSR
jgi:NADH-quinone oxidoreductase subunit H